MSSLIAVDESTDLKANLSRHGFSAHGRAEGDRTGKVGITILFRVGSGDYVKQHCRIIHKTGTVGRFRSDNQRTLHHLPDVGGGGDRCYELLCFTGRNTYRGGIDFHDVTSRTPRSKANAESHIAGIPHGSGRMEGLACLNETLSCARLYRERTNRRDHYTMSRPGFSASSSSEAKPDLIAAGCRIFRNSNKL
jgi:hypothetical protein